MVYGVAFFRAGLQTERLRARLAGTRRGFGYLLGAGFGAVTPFCSCSSIPLFLGFTTAGIPFGITMSFLIQRNRRNPARRAARLAVCAGLCMHGASRRDRRGDHHGRSRGRTLAETAAAPETRTSGAAPVLRLRSHPSHTDFP